MVHHVDHAEQWMLRLALGTDESRRRTEVALRDTWPYLGELFRASEPVARLGDAAVDPEELRAPVTAELARVLAACELAEPDVPFSSGGGRAGRHTSHLGHLLAEMQVLARQHPGASW